MDHKIYKVEFNKDATMDTVFFDGSRKRYKLEDLYESFPEFKLLGDEALRNGGRVDNMRTHIKWDYNISLDGDVIWSDGILVEMVDIDDPHIRLAQLVLTMRDKIGLTQKELGQKAGMTQADVSRIERGEGNPSLDTITRLAATLGCRYENDFAPISNGHKAVLPSDKFIPFLDEIKAQGLYRVEDMEAMPEEVRAELIDGVIYDMAEPTTSHQWIVARIQYLFMEYILNNKGDCKPFQDVAVTFKDDECDYLVPDLTIVCSRDKYDIKKIIDAPDFVLEVISEAGGIRDYTIKLRKYREKGVREYWLVDPFKDKVLVYFFEKDEYPCIYPLDFEVGVNIYNGELTINVGSILREMLQ